MTHYRGLRTDRRRRDRNAQTAMSGAENRPSGYNVRVLIREPSGSNPQLHWIQLSTAKLICNIRYIHGLARSALTNF